MVKDQCQGKSPVSDEHTDISSRFYHSPHCHFIQSLFYEFYLHHINETCKKCPMFGNDMQCKRAKKIARPLGHFAGWYAVTKKQWVVSFCRDQNYMCSDQRSSTFSLFSGARCNKVAKKKE